MAIKEYPLLIFTIILIIITLSLSGCIQLETQGGSKTIKIDIGENVIKTTTVDPAPQRILRDDIKTMDDYQTEFDKCAKLSDKSFYDVDYCFCLTMKGDSKDWCLADVAREYVTNKPCGIITNAEIKELC